MGGHEEGRRESMWWELKLFPQTDEIVQSKQVAIFVVAQYPGWPMVYCYFGWEWCGLAKVYHVYTDLVFVIHEQQWAANNLQEDKTL